MIEIRIGVIGNVDSGKSTLVSVLSNGELDDGRGLARRLILKHAHEKKSGRTSDISHAHLKIDNENYITFIDLAGHEKYLKTTLRGLTGGYIDYVLLTIGANMGVSRMTKEHISIAYALQIPIIIVVTKIDLCNDFIYNQTISDINKMIRHYRYIGLFIVEDINDLPKSIFKKKLPFFSVSNKTGENIDLLKNFLKKLKPKIKWDKKNKTTFSIDDKFQVNGVGLVVSGKMTSGKIYKGDSLFIGPFRGKWEKVVVKSLHDNFRTFINYLEPGNSGCLALKFIDKKFKVRNKSLKKGIILVKNNNNNSKKFIADIVILRTHSTNIKIDYQPVINCKTICQSAKITGMSEKYLHGGKRARVDFEFMFNPEYIETDDIFLFREGKTRGIGKIISVIG
jgi:small GTP-binding protein